MTEYIVRKAIASLGSCLQGVLLFGSASTVHGGDAFSDADVICITSHEHIGRFSGEHLSKLIELENLPIAVLKAALNRQAGSDNFILLALHTGKVIYDIEWQLSDLKDTANRLWHEGPVPLSKQNIALMQAAIEKLQCAAIKISLRLSAGKRSIEDEALLHAQLADIHVRMGALYLRSCGCWVFPPWIVDKIKEPYYLESARRNKEIFQASVKEKGRLISFLGETARAKLSAADI